MKKTISGMLCAVMVILCIGPAFAAEETVQPTPPPWVPQDEYITLDQAEVYKKENWEMVLALRTYAASGGKEPLPSSLAEMYQQLSQIESVGNDGKGDPGAGIELLLIQTKLYGNRGEWVKKDAGLRYIAGLTYKKCFTPAQMDVLALWKLRVSMVPGSVVAANWDVGPIDGALRTPNYTTDKLFQTPMLSAMPDSIKQKFRSQVFIRLDDNHINAVSPIDSTNNGRTMLPIRHLAQMLGAEVGWDGNTQTITLRRAGNKIQMTLGKTTAYCNGVPFEMDVAPYEEKGKTYLPVRFVGELMGQKVVWSPEKQTVDLIEDKSVVGDSNIEAWALPMGAVLNSLSKDSDVTIFGNWPRSYYTFMRNRFYYPVDIARGILDESWGIGSREELIDTVRSMTNHGHNDSFLESVAYIDSLSAAEYRAVLAQAQGADAYMFPYTKQLAQKWGNRGIECWDFFRMSNLAQWGYIAGYVTYPEALALVEPAARALQKDFSSWEQAYENYLDGYNWWARNDLQGQDIWETERGMKFKELRQDEATAAIFDDSLFGKEVIPVPGVTIDSLK